MRLAELVGALSLGIDLGFGQPMEHVLRQCLIALRLADRLALADADRATVYYTSLLVNVGCHTDAYEQAKWFGDDIALKSAKYDHEPGSLGDVVASMRLIGSGSPPIGRIRAGIDLARNRAGVSGMIVMHAQLAGQLAAQLGLSDDVVSALVGSYEQWDGKGLPGELAGEEVPQASRIALIAEYLEVAHRTGGVTAAVALAEQRAGRMFDPMLASCVCDDDGSIFDGLDGAGTWAAVIDAEPSLTRRLDSVRLRCRAPCDRDLRRSQVTVHPGSRTTGLRARCGGSLERGTRRRRHRDVAAGRARAGLRSSRRVELHLGQARAAQRRRVGTGPHAAVLHRADAQAVRGAGTTGADRGRLP